MITLKENQVCPFSKNCNYKKRSGSSFCWGSSSDRKNKFVCQYVNDDGTFVAEIDFRNPHDITGKMELLQE